MGEENIDAFCRDIKNPQRLFSERKRSSFVSQTSAPYQRFKINLGSYRCSHQNILMSLVFECKRCAAWLRNSLFSLNRLVSDVLKSRRHRFWAHTHTHTPFHSWHYENGQKQHFINNWKWWYLNAFSKSQMIGRTLSHNLHIQR